MRQYSVYCFEFTVHQILISTLFIPCHTIVVRYYGITLALCVSICLLYIRPYFCFQMITWVNVSGLSQNLVYVLKLWRSGLRLLMGKFHKFLTELSAHGMSKFSFLDDILSKCQWIFTKLGVCIDIVSQLIWNCTVYQSECEFISTFWIK